MFPFLEGGQHFLIVNGRFKFQLHFVSRNMVIYDGIFTQPSLKNGYLA
jgi:hypothetical protein